MAEESGASSSTRIRIFHRIDGSGNTRSVSTILPYAPSLIAIRPLCRRAAETPELRPALISQDGRQRLVVKDDKTRDGSCQCDVQAVQAAWLRGYDVGRLHHDDVVVLQALDQ